MHYLYNLKCLVNGWLVGCQVLCAKFVGVTRDVESIIFVGLQLWLQGFKKLELRLQPLKIPDSDSASKLAYYGHTIRKQESSLEKEIMQGTMPCTCRQGRPRTAWMDSINRLTGLLMEESIRMTEERDKWRKYVHGRDVESSFFCGTLTPDFF